MLCIMRHSKRLDRHSKRNGSWPDQASRPYDTPICDFSLPAKAAERMHSLSVSPFDLIICSPFRRCLQTAAVAAKTLGVSRIRINKTLGEVTECVRSCQMSSGCEVTGVVDYLSAEAQLEILGSCSGGVLSAVEGCDGEMPDPDETEEQGNERLKRGLADIEQAF